MMHVSPGLSRKLFGSQCSNNGQVNEDSEDDDQATDLNAFGSRHKGKTFKKPLSRGLYSNCIYSISSNIFNNFDKFNVIKHVALVLNGYHWFKNF